MDSITTFDTIHYLLSAAAVVISSLVAWVLRDVSRRIISLERTAASNRERLARIEGRLGVEPQAREDDYH